MSSKPEGYRTHGVHFQDVEGELNGLGMFEGGALAQHSSVRAKPDKDGYVLTEYCDSCGTQNNITIPWSEVMFLANGVTPQGFRYDMGRLVIDLPCKQCAKYELHSAVTPDEAARWAKAAIAAGVLNIGQAQAWEAQAKSIRARMGG